MTYTKEQRRIMTEKDDIGFLSDEDMWPHWPFCCLKKRNEPGENKLIVATLMKTNKGFCLWKDKTVFDGSKESWGEADETFGSALQVIQAGWIVD